MPNLTKLPSWLIDEPAGSEAPSLAISVCLSVVLVAAGPFGPRIESVVAARPLLAGLALAAIGAVYQLARRAWALRRGSPFVPQAEHRQRRKAWQAVHRFWPLTYLPLVIACGVFAAEASEGLPFWLLGWQGWHSGIMAGLKFGFVAWIASVVYRVFW